MIAEFFTNQWAIAGAVVFVLWLYRPRKRRPMSAEDRRALDEFFNR